MSIIIGKLRIEFRWPWKVTRERAQLLPSQYNDQLRNYMVQQSLNNHGLQNNLGQQGGPK